MADRPRTYAKGRTWKDRLGARILRRSFTCAPSRLIIGNPHLWIIASLFTIFTVLYYGEQLHLVRWAPLTEGFFTTVHDLHRALFFIPIIYAAVVFRMRGGLIVSFALLCVMLPRALLFSPYLHPLLRSVVFFVPAVLLSLLIAALLDQIEHGERARLQLTAVHQQLSQSFKRLEENQEQLLQAEKLTSLGQMAASIAHELNNSLAGVLVYTQLLAKKMASDTLSKEVASDYLSKMASEIDRSSRTIHNLLDFARPSAPRLSTVDVNQVIEKALSLVSHQAKLERIQVTKELNPSLPVLWADFDQLRQVFVNLILNAIQATENGGTLTLRTFPANERGVRLEIEDTGSGISPENLRKLFTPFFTTKEKGQGVGLGLTVAHEIIERHGGRIKVESKEGKGTTFTVLLPGRGGETGQSTSLQQ